MKKSLPTFLSKIHHYPEPALEAHLKSHLEDDDIATLKNLGLLKRSSDLKELPCFDCDNNHFMPIKVEDKQPYCLCPYEDTHRNYLAPEEIATWTFDVETFLRQLSSKLKIEDNIEKTKVEGLWEIGGFSKDNTRHNCYFFLGRDFSEVQDFIQELPSILRRYIVFTSKTEIKTFEGEHEMLPIEVREIVDLKSGKLSFSKRSFENQLIHGFRRVIFSPSNGQLTVNGKVIVVIKPSIPEYHFLQILWDNFNEPVSHLRILQRIYEKTGKQFEDTAQKRSPKLKGQVKALATEPDLIEQIINSSKEEDGENGYIMVNPS